MAGRTVDNVRALEIITYRGELMRVGETSPDQLDQILAGDGRQSEIYAALHALRERYAQQAAARYPGIPRRVSGYNLDELMRERGMRVARALVGSVITTCPWCR